MEELNNALNIAENRCEGNYIDDGIDYPFGFLYPFTTENISGYIDKFDLNNKSLLTVGSSSDQVFNATLYNPSDITVMDINPYTKYYYYLKLASIISLSYEEYFEFLRYYNYPVTFKCNDMVLNSKLFNKIKVVLKSLDYESYLFWNELISKYGGVKIRKELFNYDDEINKIITGSNPYLRNSSKYNELKTKAQNTSVSFVTGDVFDIDHYKKYDNIWLSNIGTYLYTRSKLFELLNKYKNCLNDNGKLLFCYLYSTSDNEYKTSWAPVYDIENFLKENSELELESFQGVRGVLHEDDNFKDSILLYRKK